MCRGTCVLPYVNLFTMITTHCYLVCVFVTIVFLSFANSFWPAEPQLNNEDKLTLGESLAKIFFPDDFNLVNTFKHRPKMRQPPEYMTNLYHMLNKAIANEESERNFTQMSVVIGNPKLKIQGVWPSKVHHTNVSTTFSFTGVTELPAQAQLLLKHKKHPKPFSSKQQILDVTQNVHIWFQTKQPQLLPLNLTLHHSSTTTGYKAFLILYYGIDHLTLHAASLQRAPFPRLKSRYTRQVSNKCQVQGWYVNFEDLGWSSWVVAPPGFNANICSGDCPDILMKDENNASTHAMLRGIYRANKPDNAQEVNGACCVPIALRGISFMYTEDNLVFLRKLENVIAEECGCR